MKRNTNQRSKVKNCGTILGRGTLQFNLPPQLRCLSLFPRGTVFSGFCTRIVGCRPVCLPCIYKLSGCQYWQPLSLYKLYVFLIRRNGTICSQQDKPPASPSGTTDLRCLHNRTCRRLKGCIRSLSLPCRCRSWHSYQQL